MKKKFADGIHDISNQQYHDAEGYSRSSLMMIGTSPYHFWYHHLSGLAEKEDETDAMILGSLFHTLLLEPHLFNDEYAVLPPINKKTNKGKQEYAEFIASAGMKTVITEEQYQTAFAMCEALKTHNIVLDLVLDAEYEKSIFWTDRETGLQFKARPDIWHAHMVVDLKSTQSAEYKYFQNSAVRGGYFLQAGMMHEACNAVNRPFEKFVFLAAEKKPPYAPAIYTLDDWSIEFGIEQFNNLKRKLVMCIEKNEWPSYPIQELRIPVWARDTLDYIPDFD